MAYTTINKPSDYFNTVLYTGNGTTQSVTGVNFQPDWSWLKCRSTAYNNRLYDSVRGALKNLISNSTAAEATADNGLSAFNSDGFTVTEGGDAYNSSGQTYVGWNWLASNTTASNTDGATTTSVSTNTTSGFSIVSWTGTASNTTIGHGLGTEPSCIIAKNRDASDSNWVVWHQNLTSGYFLKLNLTNAQDNANAYFTSNPTSSLINLSGGGAFNGSGNAMIAYCFADVKGFSKFGSYTGNGSTNGTFVYTGFKPAWIMVKRVQSAEYWYIYDTTRDIDNVEEKYLLANSSNAEGTYTNGLDILSNGFKHRNTDLGNNGSGEPYIYMAFAENPLVTSTKLPATAR